MQNSVNFALSSCDSFRFYFIELFENCVRIHSLLSHFKRVFFTIFTHYRLDWAIKADWIRGRWVPSQKLLKPHQNDEGDSNNWLILWNSSGELFIHHWRCDYTDLKSFKWRIYSLKCIVVYLNYKSFQCHLTTYVQCWLLKVLESFDQKDAIPCRPDIHPPPLLVFSLWHYLIFLCSFFLMVLSAWIETSVKAAPSCYGSCPVD